MLLVLLITVQNQSGNMFVQEDFKHLRKTTNNKLQLFPKNNLTGSSQKLELGYLEYIKVLIKEYAAYSSMHGMNIIFENNLKRLKRYLKG